MISAVRFELHRQLSMLAFCGHLVPLLLRTGRASILGPPSYFLHPLLPSLLHPSLRCLTTVYPLAYSRSLKTHHLLPLLSSPFLFSRSQGFTLVNPQGKPSRLVRLSPAAANLVNSCTVLCKLLYPKTLWGFVVYALHPFLLLSPLVPYLFSLYFHPISGFFFLMISQWRDEYSPRWAILVIYGLHS